MDRPLCELHAHVGGCLRPDDLLALIGRRTIDWAPFERRYREVYGREAGIADAIAAARAGSAEARDRFARIVVFGDECAGDFDRFSTNFGVIAAAFLSSPELAERVPQAVRDEIAFAAERIAADCRAHGVGWCELRFLIAAHRPEHVRRELYRAMLEAFARVSRDGVTLRLAIGLPREAPWEAFRIAQELALEGHEALTAIDFCHVEEGHPPKAVRALADELRAFNAAHPRHALALLYHVGESYRDKSLESAVRWCHEAADMLGAHRLGHAIALGVCPSHHGRHHRREPVSERLDQIAYDLAHADGLASAGVAIDRAALAHERERLLGIDPAGHVDHVYDARRLDELEARQAYAIGAISRTGAVAEVCPTSNRRIGGFTRPEVHQIHRFLAHGLPIVVGADDPGIFGISLRDELAWLERDVRLSRADVDAIAARAWICRSEVLTGRVADGATAS